MSENEMRQGCDSSWGSPRFPRRRSSRAAFGGQAVALIGGGGNITVGQLRGVQVDTPAW